MIRLQKSKLLLKETELKVYEIALKVGYKDAKYFNRAFKKEFGVSPDDYRRQTRIN
jgi:two-component system response regulator YesN